MAAKTNPKQKQYWRDVEALAAYEPRKQALCWLLDGKPESYIQWARTDGYWAAHGKAAPQRWHDDLCAPLFAMIPLDKAIEERHESAYLKTKSGKEDLSSPTAIKKAFQANAASHAKIEHLYSTPLQLLVTAGSVESLDAALALRSSPAERFSRGFAKAPSGWSWETKTPQPEVVGELWDLPYGTLALTLLMGRFAHADAMVRHGYCPDNEFGWYDLCRAILKLEKSGAALRDILGAEPPGEAASDWAWNKVVALQELDAVMGVKEWTPEAHAKALELLDKNIAPGYYPLSCATLIGDKELLLKMFAQGADPNCLYKTGVPMLARMDSKKLTPELLQVWLDAGARPSMGPGHDSPFGDGMCPSALYQWVWEGATDLVVQACSKAAGPVELRLKSDGKHWSPLLALALSRGHRDLVRWMIEEKGCSLEDLADDGESPCSEYGDKQIREFALALQERRELMIDPGRSTAPPPGYGGNRL